MGLWDPWCHGSACDFLVPVGLGLYVFVLSLAIGPHPLEPMSSSPDPSSMLHTHDCHPMEVRHTVGA